MDPSTNPLANLRFHRQLDIISPTDLEIPITVIGSGGIGSPTLLALTKMGCSNVAVWDKDTIEPHNLPNQIFREKDIGKSKVQAIAEICKEFNNVELITHEEFFEGKPLPSGIIICAVDSMDTRKKIWSALKLKPQIKLFIDARMGGEVARIYAVKPFSPQDIKLYEASLYSSAEASKEKCTAKAIIYNVFVIAGLIAATVKKFAKKENLKREIILDLVNLNLISTD